MSSYKSPRNELDPLDHEMERAFDAALETIKESGQRFDAETDENVQAALRRDLIEIARHNGVSDPETPKNILLTSVLRSDAPRRSPPK